MPMTPHVPTRRAVALGLTASAAALLAACHSGGVPPGAIGAGDVDHALQVLAAATQEGFAPDAFGVARIAALGRDPARRAERDQALHAALIAYARAQHGLSISRSAMPADWGLRPAAYDAETDLRQALAERRFRAWLDAQPSPLPAYGALKAAYAGYLKIIAAGGWAAIPAGPALKLGARDARVDALRARLAVEDPTLPAAPAGAAFDADLGAALGRFQTSHGLAPSGVADAATLDSLNVPAPARAAQIRASLERLRWLPRADPATRIDVNTAAGMLDYVEDGQSKMHMLAASGRPGDESPMLASNVEAITLNPPWNVPEQIAQTELAAKEQAEPGYLAAHGFTTSGDAEGGTGRLVQQPGAGSALGLIKFDFKNPYSVYLHDTPSKAAFNRANRAVSHGCVRLERAVDLARLILRESGWPPEKFDQALASGQTQSVPLKRKIPVRLGYLTAYPLGNGVGFAPDAYGWDAELLRRLDAAPGRTTA